MSDARLAPDRERRLLLTALLDSPKLSAAILGAGAVHVALAGTIGGGWPCPFARATGWPCPGCGLGRACRALVTGDWWGALRLHAFAPFLILTLGILGAGLVLRGSARDRLRAWIRRLEERTPVVPGLLAGLLLYWLLRFLLDAEGFRRLVN